MTDKRQSDALRLAGIADDGAWTFAIGVRKEIAAELRRQHAEIETLRTGYAAARLEIESLRGRSAEPAGGYPALPGRTIDELTESQREYAIAAYRAAHEQDPDFGFAQDRAWVEGAAYVDALAAGQATAAQAVVPAGWNLVPTEPTQAMLDAVVTSMDDFLLGKEAEKQYREDWAAMLAAAPAQPAAQQGVAYAALPDEREAFESWLRSVWTASYGCPKLDSGKYVHDEAQRFWECWQARATHGQAPAQTADRPEALRRSTAADGKTELFNLPGYPLMVRAVDFNRIHAESEMRRTALLDEMQKAALAAGQATAAQPGVVYAELPTSSYAGRVYEEGFLIGTCPLYTADQMRAFADATHTLRASRGEAPADAKALAEADRRAGEAERLLATCKEDVMRFEQVRSRMKYQWGAEQRVSFDEVWDEALALKKAAQAAPKAADSVTAPAPPPECETEAEKRAFAFGWFKALESERMKAESVQEDAARESEYRRGYRHGYEQRDAEVRGAMA